MAKIAFKGVDDEQLMEELMQTLRTMILPESFRVVIGAEGEMIDAYRVDEVNESLEKFFMEMMPIIAKSYAMKKNVELCNILVEHLQEVAEGLRSDLKHAAR